MGNLKKAVLNEDDDGEFFLDSIEKTTDLIRERLMNIASESIRVALLEGDSSAYLGVNPEIGEGIYLSVFIDNCVLYFDADVLFEAEWADRKEVEKMSKWFKESHDRMEKELSAETPCPYCGSPIPKIHHKTCCDKCFNKSQGE